MDAHCQLRTYVLAKLLLYMALLGFKQDPADNAGRVSNWLRTKG